MNDDPTRLPSRGPPEQGPATRRGFMGAALGAGALLSAASASARGAPRSDSEPAQTRWSAEPPQAPAVHGVAKLADVALAYWDTGGRGETVVLLHPRTGSAAIWGYQQPVLAAAGYRVIGYSRRGFMGSEAGPADRRGSAAGDLQDLMAALGVGRFHLVGSAAGGFIPFDYALSHPGRLLSITIACSLAGVADAEFRAATERLVPAAFGKLPPEFRELGPSYRSANPEGVARWRDLEAQAVPSGYVEQTPINTLDWRALAAIPTPTLLIGGDADPFMPPSRLRDVARRLPAAEAVVIREAGHSAYWEQPDAFNRAVLHFLRAHDARSARRAAQS